MQSIARCTRVSCALFLIFAICLGFPSLAWGDVSLIWDNQTLIQLEDGTQGAEIRDTSGNLVGLMVEDSSGQLRALDINPPHNPLAMHNGQTVEIVDASDPAGSTYSVDSLGALHPKALASPTPSPTSSEQPTTTGTATIGGATAGGGGGGGSGGSGGGGGGGGGGGSTGDSNNSQPPGQQIPDPPAATKGKADVSFMTAALTAAMLAGGGVNGKNPSDNLLQNLDGPTNEAMPPHTYGLQFDEFHTGTKSSVPKGFLPIVGCNVAYKACGAQKGGPKRSSEIMRASLTDLAKGQGLQREDIGIDKEVLKLDKAIYQPIDRLQKDHLGDEGARDDYLQNALTVKGVAIMTMGFLDKTVGSGLSAIQQQADMNVTQHLLKQISWTTSRMADPEAAQTFLDTDEKLEACLNQTNEEGKKLPAPETKIKRRHVAFEAKDCKEQCGDPPTKGKRPYRRKGGGTDRKTGNGTYAWCVCCSEVNSNLNMITNEGANKLPSPGKGGEDAAVEKNVWSLVERATFGYAKAKNGNDDALKTFAIRFKQFYGDYHFELAQSKRDDAPYHHLVFAPPEFSGQKVIRAWLNGCAAVPDNWKDFSLTHFGDECDTENNFGFAEKDMICPGFVAILQNAKKIIAGQADDDLKTKIAAASVGLPIDARMIQNILRLNGQRLTELKANEEPEGRMRRGVFYWCLASAAAAAEKHHAGFIPMARQVITYTNGVGGADKEKLMMLLNRRTEELAAEKRLAMASFIVNQGLAVYSHRADIQAMAEAAASTAAGMRDMANLGYATTMTDNAAFFNNGGGG